MKRTDLRIGLAVLVLGLIAAFWMLILSPKRDEAESLKQDVDQLQSSLQEQQGIVAAAKQAQRNFGPNYHRLVVMGKAVPADGDQASLLVQLQSLAERSNVQFRALALSESASGAAAPAPTSPPQSAGSSGAEATPAAESTSSATPTEAAAAGLPIGATVGPAGLGVMPYDLKFQGGFFEVADFLASVDHLVKTSHRRVAVDGRLLTVNGFALSVDQRKGFPSLLATLAVTSYVTPSDQGLTAGATSTGPAPAEATPTSTPSSAPPSTTTPPSGAPSTSTSTSTSSAPAPTP